MGLWITFAFFAAVFALMGWSVYSTHRASPTETLAESKSPAVGFLDAIDVLVVLVAWSAVVIGLRLWVGVSQYTDLALLIAFGSGAVWLRRRLLPGTVVRFHRNNLALRCASVFCGIGSPIALLFGLIAGWLEEPPSLGWSFFLAAAGLMAAAVWLHTIEFRRRPQQSFGD